MAKRKRSYYKIKTGMGDNFLVSKLDENLDVVTSYAMYNTFDGTMTCNCPSRKRPCKHIAMLHRFHDVKQVDGDLFYDPERDGFVSMESLQEGEGTVKLY